MKKIAVIAALAAVCSGCVSFSVREEHKKKIAAYRQEGSLRQAMEDIGRTVNPVPTMFWGLVPGANKIHMARKIGQSPYRQQIERDYPGLITDLYVEGGFSVAVSWFPLIYYFAVPCQIGSGVYPDVVKINNLMWMYRVESQSESQNPQLRTE
jgi:hypothetical protein